jgi:hypothetical protein
MLIVYFELCSELTEPRQKFQTKSYARPVVVIITITRASWNAVKNKDAVIRSLFTME